MKVKVLYKLNSSDQVANQLTDEWHNDGELPQRQQPLDAKQMIDEAVRIRNEVYRSNLQLNGAVFLMRDVYGCLDILANFRLHVVKRNNGHQDALSVIREREHRLRFQPSTFYFLLLPLVRQSYSAQTAPDEQQWNYLFKCKIRCTTS
jgi:hypothetical protein